MIATDDDKDELDYPAVRAPRCLAWRPRPVGALGVSAGSLVDVHWPEKYYPLASCGRARQADRVA